MDTDNRGDQYNDDQYNDDCVTYVLRNEGYPIINNYNIETNKYKLLLIIICIINNNNNNKNIPNILKNIFEYIYNPIYLVSVSYDSITTNIGRKLQSEFEQYKTESIISYDNFEYHIHKLSKMYNDYNITNLQYYIDKYVNKQNRIQDNYIKYYHEEQKKINEYHTEFTIYECVKLYIINKHEYKLYVQSIYL
jgi:hypothetical protein